MLGVDTKFIATSLLLCATALLCGCFAIPVDTGFESEDRLYRQVVSQDRDLYAHIDPLFIDQEVKNLLDKQVSLEAPRTERVEQVQEILWSENFLNIQYSDDRTHTAMEAFHARAGNCLSVMNLYIAMARYVGIDAEFQTVRVQPSWDRRGDLLVLSDHINATGRISIRKRYVVDFTPEIALQQLTSNIVSDRYARALYFNNLGVEAQLENEFEQALGYYKNALFLEPELSPGWNNIGSVYRRLDQTELAEFSYMMAFKIDNNNASAINNLARLYRLQGDEQRAAQYEAAIQRFNDRNPYYHYIQGLRAHAAADLRAARRSLRRALRLKEVEPDFYLALAEVNQELGYSERASVLMATAQALVSSGGQIYRPSDQRLRVIDDSTILDRSTPGISILVN